MRNLKQLAERIALSLPDANQSVERSDGETGNVFLCTTDDLRALAEGYLQIAEAGRDAAEYMLQSADDGDTAFNAERSR